MEGFFLVLLALMGLLLPSSVLSAPAEKTLGIPYLAGTAGIVLISDVPRPVIHTEHHVTVVPTVCVPVPGSVTVSATTLTASPSVVSAPATALPSVTAFVTITVPVPVPVVVTTGLPMGLVDNNAGDAIASAIVEAAKINADAILEASQPNWAHVAEFGVGVAALGVSVVTYLVAKGVEWFRRRRTRRREAEENYEMVNRNARNARDPPPEPRDPPPAPPGARRNGNRAGT